MTKSQTFSSFVTAICNHFSDHFYAKNIDIFNYCQPTPLEEPKLVHLNQSLCEDLNLNPDIFIETINSCISKNNPNIFPKGIIADDFLKQRLKEIKLN